ncbi:MAG TPA: hypothetical protein VK712_02450 [Verrucomicrobiae bacterium]|jgi:hypothetical protein|nr:hypothetical protein [Verrucomicrobiae bacterium]
MIKHNQDGAVNGVVIALVLTVLLLVGAVAFGVWAYGGRQDYKNNVNAKISVAVTAAKAQEDQANTAQFNLAAEQPLRTYVGPEAYGSLVINYPKTWSGYVDASGTAANGALVDGYFYPNVVPSITAVTSAFALHVQVLNQSYNQSLQSFASPPPQGQTRTVVPYALPKVPSVIGVEVSGVLTGTKVGTMVVLPLRSNTLEIWTDGNTFLSDFNNNILPNFSFSP